MNNNTKHKIKLLRFWLKRDLKPFIRIEPKISHLNVDYFKAKETNKVFNDPVLSDIKGKLSLKDILSLELPKEDLKAFIELHCPLLVTQLNKL